MVGNWSGKYDDGISPYAWNGSSSILEEFLKKRKGVKYGQCWTFSAIATTGIILNLTAVFFSSFLLGRIVLFMLHFKSIWIGLLGEGFYMIEVPRSIIPLYYMTVLIKSPGVLFQCLGPWEFRPDASLTSARPTTVTTAYRLTTSGLRKDGPGR